MELRKKNLHMMQKKSEAQNQITFDEDYNVPDQKAAVSYTHLTLPTIA